MCMDFKVSKSRERRHCPCLQSVTKGNQQLHFKNKKKFTPKLLTATQNWFWCTKHNWRLLPYYRKRGSASHIVCEWLLWAVERERERDACDIIYITLKSLVIMHMITSTACRPYASTRSEPVECLKFMYRQGAWHLSAPSSSRAGWLMNDDGEVEALRSLDSLPRIIQQHFVGMLQARRIDQVDVYFLFEWHGSAFENSLDSGCPFTSIPARCTKTTLVETWYM